MLKIDKQRCYDNLKKIGFCRPSATDLELKVAEILRDECRGMGFEAEIETFHVPGGHTLTATFEVLEPYQKVYKVHAHVGCGATPEGGITTEFAYIEDGMDASLVDVKGKIVLCHRVMSPDHLQKLLKAGVVGVMQMYGTINDTVSRGDLTENLYRPIGEPMPWFTIHTADAQEMVRMGAKKVHFEIQNTHGYLESRNVVATIPGTEYPDQIIGFGAHMDSVEYSTGVYDDGCGCAVLLELMHYFKENPPKRTLKFMFFGSEETGCRGSKAYITMHKDELEKYLFNIQMDVGGSVLGREILYVTATDHTVAFMDALARIEGQAIDVGARIYSGDATTFAFAGVPGMTFTRGGAAGAAYIHSRFDVMDFISPEGLASTGNFMLTTAEIYANAVLCPSPREIDTKLTKSDAFLTRFANWEKFIKVD